jgi:hypothetical protein
MERRDPGSRRFDDPHSLVTEDPACVAGGHIPFQDVQVGPADGRSGHPDHGIGGREQFGLGTVLQFHTAGTGEYEGFHGDSWRGMPGSVAKLTDCPPS